MKTATKTFDLTEKETQFLVTMSQSDFFEGDMNRPIWDYSVNEYLPYAGRIRSGVVSSLEQKGILWVTKKEKGDIAGVYALSPEAQQDAFIIKIFTERAMSVLLPPVEETKPETTVSKVIIKVGDIHANGKWFWKEIKPGVFDWRTILKDKQLAL